ncbi:MAG: B12-binding domain-containing radical SAM protein [bacterium]
MNANFASVMPQVVGTWCEQEGHEVKLICFTGYENLVEEIPQDLDLVFITSFSHAAQLAYALSNLLRSKGTITALGGPHARCYPDDAQKYFDYVFGLTDKETIQSVLQDCSQHRPVGVYVSANQQPETLPGVRERWHFIEPNLEKAPLIKSVSMIGSFGCPYTCSFCIDSTIPYQALNFDVLKEDLQFLQQKFERPRVSWYDPNFGIQFDNFLDAIEEVVPPDSMDFFAEMSLALLSESHLKRLQKNGFKVIMPGIESWYDMGGKSKVGNRGGDEKVRLIAEHVNMVLSYIPYLQANFVIGLDVDEGPEPFELTKQFVDMAPAAYPAYCLLSAFGQGAPLNLEYQRDNRVLPFPFHFLNTQSAMNVKPKNYSWPEFFDYLIDLTRYTFSWRAVLNRHKKMLPTSWRWLNLLRARTAQGIGRFRYFSEVRRHLEIDTQFRDFFEQETEEVPQFFVDWIKKDLGPLWEWLPEGALYHDQNAYLKSKEGEVLVPENVPAS